MQARIHIFLLEEGNLIDFGASVVILDCLVHLTSFKPRSEPRGSHRPLLADTRKENVLIRQVVECWWIVTLCCAVLVWCLRYKPAARECWLVRQVETDTCTQINSITGRVARHSVCGNSNRTHLGAEWPWHVVLSLRLAIRCEAT